MSQKNNTSNPAVEYLPVVDNEGHVIGRATREACHFHPEHFLLHPVVHLHLFHPDGRLFLQLRPAHKKVQPGKWDTAAGGHVDYGESIREALLRESREEIGVDVIGATLITQYRWETPVEHELVYLHALVSDQLPVIDPDEVEEGRYWSYEELQKAMSTGWFTPNLEKELSMLLEQAWLNA